MKNMHQVIAEGREYPADVRISQIRQAFQEFSKESRKIKSISEIEGNSFQMILKSKLGDIKLKVSTRDNEKTLTDSFSLMTDVTVNGVFHKKGERLLVEIGDIKTSEEYFKSVGTPVKFDIWSARHAMRVLERDGWLTGTISPLDYISSL